MLKSLLYAVNTLSQAVIATGSPINFGAAIHDCGNNVAVIGGDVIVRGAGYYSIDTNITLVATGAGTAVVTLYKDGMSIPGATQSITIGTAADNVSLTVPAIIRQSCCRESVITAEITGIVGNITNAAILVEKV